MNKRELKLLEKAFESEVNSALNGGVHLLQTKSMIANKLVNDGMLEKRTITLEGRFPVVIEGYELTHAGRLGYCSSLPEP